MNIQRTINQVVDRIEAPTPTHFKRIIRFGLGMVVVGFILIFLAALFPTPAFLAIEKAADKLIYVGLSMTGVSITARDDKK